MILELDNVELYFKSKPILNGIYLRAETGTLTTIFGRNGSGKSSLLRIIFGDLRPKYKHLRLDGHLIKDSLFSLGHTKLLPDFSFCPNSLKLDILFKTYKVSWQEFKMLFPEFKATTQQRFKQLSTGEKRIIETYLSLKCPAKIVLLDEPFKYLSPLSTERIKALIAEESSTKLIIGADHTPTFWNGLDSSSYQLNQGSLRPFN